MNSNFVQIVTILGLLGIPSIFTMTMWCIKCCQKYSKQLRILMKSQQAQMRNKLLEQYHKYTDEQKWVSEEQLENWMNQYNSYHELGKNGVLDMRKDQLLTLPNTPPNKED